VSRLSLGWQLPTKVIDLSPLFRCVVNGRIVPQGKGLLGALAYYGIPSVEAIYKDKIRGIIKSGWPAVNENKAEILKYVMTDVDPLFELFSRLMAEPEFDLSTALHWGEFAAVSARMEHRGIPLDMEIVPQLLDKKAWMFVRDAVIPKINAQYDVYVQDKTGEWHFNIEKFDALCARLRYRLAANENRQARSTTKNSQEHVSGIPGIRVPTPAPACSRQDAQDQACRRIRRSQPNRAMAIQSEDFTHAT
jgi:hypothetical protein